MDNLVYVSKSCIDRDQIRYMRAQQHFQVGQTLILAIHNKAIKYFIFMYLAEFC